MPGLMTREAVLLFGGVALLVGIAFIADRVLRSRRHGFSIRLQLFFAIVGTSILATGVIGTIGPVSSTGVAARWVMRHRAYPVTIAKLVPIMKKNAFEPIVSIR